MLEGAEEDSDEDEQVCTLVSTVAGLVRNNEKRECSSTRHCFHRSVCHSSVVVLAAPVVVVSSRLACRFQPMLMSSCTNSVALFERSRSTNTDYLGRPTPTRVPRMDKHRCDERHKTAGFIEVWPALVPAQWPFRPVYDTAILLLCRLSYASI